MQHKQAVPLAGLVMLAVAVAMPVRGSRTSPPRRPASARALLAPAVPAGGVRFGRLDPHQSVEFDVSLTPSHPAELASLIARAVRPGVAALSPVARAGRIRAPLRTRTVAASTRSSTGCTTPGSRTRASSTVASRCAPRPAPRRALGVTFARDRAADGSESFAADAAPLVPRALAPAITSIVGLSDAAHLQPRHRLLTSAGAVRPARQAHAQSCAASITQQANSLGGWTTRQIGAKYQVPALLSAGLNGAGKTIAIYELAPHTPADTSAYLDCFGLHNVVTTRAVSGGAPASPGGTVEANLDIEAAAVIAPGAKIVSYEGPNTEVGSIRVWQAIVGDDKAQVVSTSWGICEQFETVNERTSLHAVFTQAAAEGQTIFAASGDSGSEDCLHASGDTGLAVDSPANQPLVTGVGGTALKPNIAVTNPSHEPVWNDCVHAVDSGCAEFGGAAGGGGLSGAYAKPSWQPTARASTCSPGCRQVPDLAANSGIGEMFLSGGQWGLIGDEHRVAEAGRARRRHREGMRDPLGGVQPQGVRAHASGGIYGTALRDVPAGQGNNDLTRSNGNRYSSGSGYDLATGMGTPLAAGLVCPEVTRVVPVNAAGRDAVRVTGLGLRRATIRFGNKAAKVVSRTTTSATVVVPKGTGAVQVRATGPMGSGTLRASFTYRA